VPQCARTGRLAAGRYLNWSHDVGYWLDHAPRDAYGQPLRPFESAAADVGVLPAGAGFTIVDCGREADGSAIDAAVCARLRQARWTVTDQFTPGFGGPVTSTSTSVRRQARASQTARGTSP
jgi:hypothetical protein